MYCENAASLELVELLHLRIRDVTLLHYMQPPFFTSSYILSLISNEMILHNKMFSFTP